jgi:thiamine-phosphate pyrophosphorylase/hydroxymethylpyrimidine kinase/phosphomethylpyrimidine kinase/thiamine-phosphate diphosphorylase
VGLAQLAQWAQHAAPYPVVAIGGISLERLPGVLACGVDGVAVVSAVTLAVDPRQATLDGLKIARKG